MKRVLHYLKPQSAKVALQVTIKFSATLLELFLPWILEHIIDIVAPQKDLGMLAMWGTLMLLCAVAAFLGAVYANRMAAKIAASFTRSLRHSLFEKVTALPSEKIDGFTVPSLISRISTDTYHVNDMVDRMMRLGIRAPILLVGGLLVCSLMEPVLTLILVATLPLLGGLLILISKRSIPLYTKAQQCAEELVRRIQENMTGVRIIKALSKEEVEKERFDDASRNVIETDQRAEITMAAANPLMNIFLNVGMAVVIVIGAFRVDSGLTEPGKIIAFLHYFTILLNGLLGITRIFTLCSKGIASGNRVGEVLDTPEKILSVSDQIPQKNAYISFENVSFSYNKIRENVSNLNFTLDKGQTLGIIGATGSGKSTVFQLMLRFYQPDKGTIYLEGKPLNTYRKEDLHHKFGVVFQNDFLFGDTIKNNIDFERTIADEARVKAVSVAQAGIINEQEEGDETILAERGMNLSGGQRQRLLIARALAADPEILLLDDCSSALDYRTDAQLRKALKAGFKHTTTLIIAQRVSSILFADKILVLDDGKTVGYGTHDELLKTCEHYRQIYLSQMGEEAA